jgi:hypothetical protein
VAKTTGTIAAKLRHPRGFNFLVRDYPQITVHCIAAFPNEKKRETEFFGAETLFLQ